jgi:hypothetical protein
MRSYIFTPREREVIRRFLRGEVGAGDPLISQIHWRMKNFEALSGDVDLYLKLRSRFAESVST